jgi:proteasome lid subunit RPN8/RPN11
VKPEADGALHLRLARLAEAAPGRECCGLVVATAAGRLDLWPMDNVAPDPAQAFDLDPVALLQAMKRLDAGGERLVAVFHSHPRGGAGLSGRDLAGALLGGAPALPGVEQWIVALEAGRASRLVAHRWTGGGFVGEQLWSASAEPPGGASGR